MARKNAFTSRKQGETLKVTKELYRKAGSCETQENWQEAIELYQEILLLEPNDDRAYFYLGSNQGKIGDFLGAIKSLEKSFEINPLSVDTLIELGNSLDQSGKVQLVLSHT